MKRLYTAALIVVLLGVLYVFQINTAAVALKDFSQELNASQGKSASEAAVNAEKALSEFESRSGVLKLFVDEDKLEEISKTALRYIVFSKNSEKILAEAEYSSLSVLLSEAIESTFG